MQKTSYRLLVASALISNISLAENLNTQLPSATPDRFSVPIQVDLPAQPLSASLRQLALQARLSVMVDSNWIQDKKAPAVRGRYNQEEILKMLLAGSDLEGKIEDDRIVIKNIKKNQTPSALELDKVEVRAKRFYEVGPLPGLGLTKEEIPGNVQSISAQEIKEAHSLSITDLMNRKLQSVTVNDYQGNPFQMDVQYRGFTAGPQIGTPQGLSVFIDGIRVNEPFGDVVNWDMLPMNALASVDVFPGSNPIFGLNTLGGAFSLKTKDGFNHAGGDIDVLTGSFGRKQLQVEGGWNNGTIGLFGSGNFFLEDGWRQNSPSRVNQAFGKASYRGDKLDLNFSTLLVQTKLTGNGLLPSEMYDQERSSIFTAPDKTDNNLAQFQLSGAFQATETFSITGQVYRRNSKRHQVGADVFTGFTDADYLVAARRVPAPGEQWTCLLDSHNSYGVPDYFVVSTDNPASDISDLLVNPFFITALSNGYMDPANLPTTDALGMGYTFEKDSAGNIVTKDSSGTIIDTARFNSTDFPDEFAKSIREQFNIDRNVIRAYLIDRTTRFNTPPTAGDITGYSNGEPYFAIENFQTKNISAGLPNSVISPGTLNNTYYYTADGKKNYVFFVSPRNNTDCEATQAKDVPIRDGRAFTYLDPKTGKLATLDGLNGSSATGGTGTGPGTISYTEPVTGKTYYTPTSVFNDNNINQMVNGASMQLNWNLEQHKFMMGASIDNAKASYFNSARLGLLDADRNAYLAPDLINPAFAAAFIPLENNTFKGGNITKSLYFSETWTPRDDWHFNASARYNYTQTKSTIATRTAFADFGLAEFISYPDSYGLCFNGDCSNVPTGYTLPAVNSVLDDAETEKFKYRSFNPSLGATWQATEHLNAFANIARGARVPSAIELGCAFDKRPTSPTDPTPRSITEYRQCNLPTALSGDPYLKQIRSTSYDLGIRGNFDDAYGSDKLQWNLGVYQTDLEDDIYFINVGGASGFFDNIGRTRRRGIEAGLSGKKDRFGFSLNYSLTEATFQDRFEMISNDNSSATQVSESGGNYITVKPGDRMPGVPLNNLNATFSYDVTPDWKVSLSAVAHSMSFLRGNENNEHQPGVVRYVSVIDPTSPTGIAKVPLVPTNNRGYVPGYATFNFQTSYKLSKEWTASLIVSNLFDKEYFSAGRLGRNPFSPSINGDISVSGYNHNSGDWLSTNFIAPGAPRGIWFSLNWRFQPD